MALEAIVNRDGIFKVILQERVEGVYVFSFPGPENKMSLRDDLQDDFDMAKRFSLNRYGITEDMWHVIGDTGLMAPAPKRKEG